MLTRRFTSGRAGAATLAGACALLFGVLSASGTAVADGGGGGGGGNCDPVTGVCTIGASTPPSAGGGGSGGSGGGGGGGGSTCSYQGTTVSCYLPAYGYWDGVACYDQLDNPQPPPSAVVWYGHNPADGGAIYWEYCPYTGGAAGADYFLAYLPTPPPGQPAPETPGQIAAAMYARLKVYSVAVGSAPAAGGTGLVGLPVWLWSTSPMRLPPLRVTVGGITVTMTAVIGHVEWDMGDGSQDFQCDNLGTAYQTRFGAEKPVCGYASGYRAAGDYTVTATAVWGVTWTSNIGISNLNPRIINKTSNVTLTIDQAQGLNVAPQEAQ